ncbi:unnamed protein product [Tuber aestivum]|uniref:C3H1-type domain-containing protein n=1 Tax=Tuber aestivum TaxID=59557 RepID=A0A292PMB4_9PEZI|nr:unnamed protein product [Tuber aestivum]
MSGYIYKPPPPPPPPAPAPATNSSYRGRGRGGGRRGGGGGGGGGGNNNHGQRGRGWGSNARGGGGGRGYRDPLAFPQAHYNPYFPQPPNQYGPPQQQQFNVNSLYHLHPLPLPAPPQWPQQNQQPQQPQQPQHQTPSYLSYSQEKSTPAPTLTSTSYKTAQSGWPATPSYAHFTPPTPQLPLPSPSAPRARKDEKPDMDEETWLRLNGGKLLGTNLKPPETPEEIEEWIRERKRMFPTRERVAAKFKEEEEKRRFAEASGAGAGAERVLTHIPTMPPRQALTTAQQPAQNKRKRTEQGPDSDHPSDPLPDPDPDTDSCSQSSSPEELSASKKPPPHSLTTSPSPRKKPTKHAALCHVFKTTGKCRFGGGCRYRHAPPESKQKQGKERKGVKSLYQRLLDQDREKENEIVISAVRYLFERGLLSVPAAGGGE